jgi:hypothetical protein
LYWVAELIVFSKINRTSQTFKSLRLSPASCRNPIVWRRGVPSQYFGEGIVDWSLNLIDGPGKTYVGCALDHFALKRVRHNVPIALEVFEVGHLLSTPQRLEHTANIMEAGDTSSYHEIKRGLASKEMIVIRPGHPRISQRVRQ